MPIAHIAAAGMGGMRTTGDLVAWMQMARGMKIDAAKAHVARTLGVAVGDLTNEDVITPLRRELGLGSVSPTADDVTGILAKRRIARLLGISIPSVNRFESRLD